MKNLIINYCKEKGLKLTDIREELLDFAVKLFPSMDSVFGKDYDLDDQRHKDLYEFQKKIAKEVIDFINGNEGIREMISSKRDEIKETIGDDYNPDLRVQFWIDDLESSMKEGEWTPYSDSSLGIYLGPINVISSE